MWNRVPIWGLEKSKRWSGGPGAGERQAVSRNSPGNAKKGQMANGKWQILRSLAENTGTLSEAAQQKPLKGLTLLKSPRNTPLKRGVNEMLWDKSNRNSLPWHWQLIKPVFIRHGLGIGIPGECVREQIDFGFYRIVP